MSLTLRTLLAEGASFLPESVRDRILQFHELVVKENEVQNLTRLISPQDFYEGHVLDVLELHKSASVEYPAIDLGSGVGVPGLLAAAIWPGNWVLVESEKRKAEFLERGVATLGLSNQVQVYPGRIEDYFKGPKGLTRVDIRSIVARAVGPVERIHGWIRKCSTWNNLILFKGPGWDGEWNSFQEGKFAKELLVKKAHLYTVGAVAKTRRIIQLSRVPRGT